MGITARGAWESVKRHFREMDVNIHETPFTAVGVGDMSGDVFGNGMLRETTTKLLAAFDHRDIFIDPDPDPVKAFAERKRLFDLPRSSWQDYDKALISKGGGVYPRSSKSIALSAEARALFGVGESVTPQELMKAILKAQVDLLFFGGIGTYVRSSQESDEAAGDRANDAIRVSGADLRCKVIGEGANLGMTQRGRIEAAQAGIRLNTDAIDNSAGVNTSDVEVNIKIALSPLVARGRAEDRGAQRAAGRNDRRSGAPGAAQQLPADAGALLGATARAGGLRLPAAADADSGNARRARPRGRIPARRDGACRAAQARARR